MNQILGGMIFLILGVFLWGQVKVFRSEPMTSQEIEKEKARLFEQLDSLDENPEQEHFAKTILKEIKNLDEQKVLLTKQKDGL